MVISTMLKANKTEQFWQLYEFLFNEKRPFGWTVDWGVEGMTDQDRKAVYLMAWDLEDPYDLETAIHELVHVAYPQLQHGKVFEKAVKKLTRKARKLVQHARD